MTASRTHTLTCSSPDYLAAEADVDADRPDPAEYSWNDDGPIPAGRPLAAAISKALNALGWETLHTWATPHGHAFDCRRTTTRFDIDISLTSEEDAHWQISVKRRAGLFRRLLHRKSDTVELTLLATHLRQVLDADPHVTLT